MNFTCSHVLNIPHVFGIGNGMSMCMGNGCGLRLMGNRYWIRVCMGMGMAFAWSGQGLACIDKLVKTRQGQGMDTCMCMG